MSVTFRLKPLLLKMNFDTQRHEHDKSQLSHYAPISTWKHPPTSDLNFNAGYCMVRNAALQFNVRTIQSLSEISRPGTWFWNTPYPVCVSLYIHFSFKQRWCIAKSRETWLWLTSVSYIWALDIPTDCFEWNVLTMDCHEVWLLLPLFSNSQTLF